jgi:hypothetical protein
MSGEERDVFIESIGKLIGTGILAKQSLENCQSLGRGGIPCGVTAFIALFGVIQEASLNKGRLVPREKCEEIYGRTKGIGRFECQSS